MKLLNLNPESRAKELIELAKPIEEKLGVEFALFFGFNGPVSKEYIAESIEGIKEEPSDDDDSDVVKIIPVVISGYDQRFTSFKEYRVTPMFSNEPRFVLHKFYERVTYLKSVPESTDYGEFEGEVDDLDDSHRTGGKSMFFPSKALFGEMFTNREDSFFYIYYNVFDLYSTSVFIEICEYIINYMGYIIDHTKVENPMDSFVPNYDHEKLNIAKASSKFHNAKIAAAQRKIEESSEEIARLQKLLILHYENLENGKRYIAGQSNEEHIIAQLETIRDRDDVAWVTFTDETLLKFLIKDINISRGDVSVPVFLGDIEVTVNTIKGSVKFNNITQRRSGYACEVASHPHDSSSGNNLMCLGEISAYIPELISQMELASLAELIINYAKSVNRPDEAGKFVTEWEREV